MLYLVRHATTEQGAIRPPGDLTPASPEEWLLDFGLTEQGRRTEAESLRLRFAQTPTPDRVLASPRRRTRETAEIALPGRTLVIDDRLHEWHAAESMAALQGRARWLLHEGLDDVVAVFTHGGFIRAVLAALLVGEDDGRFAATFHDLRRILHIWNASLTIVGQ
jgi:broad specificity phosphatase PhoE